MIGLAEIRDWLKTFGGAENYYIGKLDNKKQKSIGVYQRKSSSPAQVALGGLENTTYETKRISILVHWNQNARETEDTAYSLFNKLQRATNVTICGTKVHFIRLMVEEPVDVGTDDNGVYERVIWLDLIHERR